MRFRRLVGQTVRFGITTGLSALLSLGVPILLHEIFLVDERVAVGIGFVAAFIANTVLVPRFVFRSKQGWRRESAIYVVSSLIFRAIEYAAFLALFDLIEVDYRISVILVLAISSLSKFFYYRFMFAPK